MPNPTSLNIEWALQSDIERPSNKIDYIAHFKQLIGIGCEVSSSIIFVISESCISSSYYCSISLLFTFDEFFSFNFSLFLIS